MLFLDRTADSSEGTRLTLDLTELLLPGTGRPLRWTGHSSKRTEWSLHSTGASARGTELRMEPTEATLQPIELSV